MDNENILVSICMITYNHEKYIAQAIEGVLMQKTDFQIRLVIGDDCSIDNTRQICMKYQNKFPHLIQINLLERNVGIVPNFSKTLSRCSGKYIALCEGDDYWTDPYKLQKQVNFLEANPDFGLVHSNGIHVNSENKENDTTIHPSKSSKNRSGWIFPSFINGNNDVMTLTVVFRRSLVDFSDYPSFGIDFWLYGEIARKSLLHYFNEPLAAYRSHNENTVSKNKFWLDQTLTDAQFDLFKRYFFYTNSLYLNKLSKRILILYKFLTLKILKDKRLYVLLKENKKLSFCFFVVIFLKILINPFEIICNKFQALVK